ncbi:MAG: pseudouridine synthase [Verrucomicrobiaceae bacterium]|nr:pseudouridine synthase [Verrucomicrobiaceae bacterium]
MRLNRYLSQCGVASRRACEQIILEGRVLINGHVIKELATQVKESDEVQVDLKPVEPAAGIVVAFHKPRGFICSRGDTHDRATIYAILPPQYQTLHYVGRLDKESEGLLLLTNRGELSQRLTHPSEGVEKEYEVTIDSDFSPEDKLKLLHGMITEEGFAKAERVWVDSARRINVVLKQGLKRQIRLMFYQLGYEVERLLRVRVGGLALKGLPRGAWKELSEAEVQRYFIKHKERERVVRPVKVKKSDDEASDTFSSDAPAAAAPFKVRPGPKARTPAVRKTKRFSKAADEGEEASSPSLERPGRPSRSTAPPQRHFGARPVKSSRAGRSDETSKAEGDAPRRRSSTKSSFKSKRDFTGDRPARTGKPTRGARAAEPEEGHDSEAPRRRSSTKSSFKPKASGLGARREEQDRPAGGKPGFSRKPSSKPKFKSGNKAPRGSKGSGGSGGSGGRPGRR